MTAEPMQCPVLSCRSTNLDEVSNLHMIWQCRECGYQDDGEAFEVMLPTFDVYVSELDGTLVVHVDTNDMPEDPNGEPLIRIYLNDEPVFENPLMPELEEV